MTIESKVRSFSDHRRASTGLLFVTIIFAIVFGFKYVERWPTFLEITLFGLLALTLIVAMWALWSIEPEKIIIELDEGRMGFQQRNVQTGSIVLLLKANLPLPIEQANVMWDQFADLNHDYDDSTFREICRNLEATVAQALLDRSKERRLALSPGLQALLVNGNGGQPIPAHVYSGFAQQAARLENFEHELRKRTQKTLKN